MLVVNQHINQFYPYLLDGVVKANNSETKKHNITTTINKIKYFNKALAKDLSDLNKSITPLEASEILSELDFFFELIPDLKSFFKVKINNKTKDLSSSLLKTLDLLLILKNKLELISDMNFGLKIMTENEKILNDWDDPINDVWDNV